MKIRHGLLTGVVAGISALAVSSCAYDPYYSGGSSYSSGGGSYGNGYGYGNSSFTTSYFVSTGNPQWGYDPYAGAYYDYGRHCYYDPYLNGYYPTGYRPRYVSGSPHPHGWSRGGSHIAPPSQIRSYNLTNYENRGERYRSLGRDWSSDVRINQPGHDEHQEHDSRGSSQGSFFGGGRGSSQGDYDRNDGRNQNSNPQHGSDRNGENRFSRPDSDDSGRSRGSSRFGGENTSVSAPSFNAEVMQEHREAPQPQPEIQREAPQQQFQPQIEQQPQPQFEPQPQPQREMVPQDGGGGRGGRGVEERGSGPGGFGQG